MPVGPSRTAEMVCFARAGEALRPAARRIVDDPYARLFFLRLMAQACDGPPRTPLPLAGSPAELTTFCALPSPRHRRSAGGRAFGHRRRSLRPLLPAPDGAEHAPGARSRAPLPIAGTPAELTTFVLCRHRAIDDRLAAALDGGVEQVVVLGAGYDTRAWRFAEKLGGRPVWEVDFPATARRKAGLARRHAAELPATTLHRVEVDFERESFAERLEARASPPARARSSSGKACRCT